MSRNTRLSNHGPNEIMHACGWGAGDFQTDSDIITDIINLSQRTLRPREQVVPVFYARVDVSRCQSMLAALDIVTLSNSSNPTYTHIILPAA